MNNTWRSLLILVLLSCLYQQSHSKYFSNNNRRLLTLADTFGLSRFYQPGLAISKSTTSNGTSSLSFLVDPKTYANLTSFVTKTAYCLKKCKITNVVCIVFFRCTNQLIKFFMVVLIPLFLILIVVVCCTWRYWTCNCWWKYMMIFTGVGFVVWIIYKCCCKKKSERTVPRVPV